MVTTTGTSMMIANSPSTDRVNSFLLPTCRFLFLFISSTPPDQFNRFSIRRWVRNSRPNSANTISAKL